MQITKMSRITLIALFVFISCVLFQEVISFPTKDFQHPDISDVDKGMMYLLYTRKNPMDPQFFVLSDLDYLSRSNFDANKTVKILVHGWSCSYKSAFNTLIKNAYLMQYDTNVIVVDWEPFAKGWYWTVKRNVVPVGTVIAYMIDELISQLGVKAKNIHVVGHSLGAHVVGVVGLFVKNALPRITGLDPAGPLFSSSETMRIGTNSAEFVDIIHTAGYFTGFHGQLGHVDFYPNGGYPVQPGCALDFTTLRSHRRAYWLFAESIVTPQGFTAVSCPSWQEFKISKCPLVNTTQMGEHVSSSARGTFFLTTNSQSPFALGNKSLIYDLSTH